MMILRFSPQDTRRWADNPDSRWPGSTLADNPITLEFDDAGNLIDITDHRSCDTCELFAFIDDARDRVIFPTNPNTGESE